MAEWKSFRRKFIRRIPVGTLVEDLNMYNEKGERHFAITAPDAIYKDQTSQMVNVINIDGVEGLNGIWTARFVHKIRRK